MNKILLSGVVCLVAASSFSQIINGSFEDGFTGWDITPGDFIIGHPGTQPIGTQGQVCADLGGGDISGAVLSQTFNCNPNTDYELSFQSVCNAENDLTRVTKWEVAITDGGILLAKKDYAQKNVGQPTGDFGFVKRTIIFHTGPKTTTATVSFIDITPDGGILVDTGLDQVQIYPVHFLENLLINSSFERGLDAWDTTPGDFIIGHEPAQPIGTEGYFVADLGGGDISGAVLSQSFNCSQAGEYRLDFANACNAGTDRSSVATWDVVIAADGVEIARQSYWQRNIGLLDRRFGFRGNSLRFSVPPDIQDVTVSFVDTTPDGGIGVDSAFDQVKVFLIKPHD